MTDEPTPLRLLKQRNLCSASGMVQDGSSDSPCANSSNYSQNEPQQRYEHSEKGRKRKREYMKRYREKPEVQQREAKEYYRRDRKEYYREYRRRKRAEQKGLEQ